MLKGAGKGALDHVMLDAFTIVDWLYALFMHSQLDKGQNALSPHAWHAISGQPEIRPVLIP